MADKQPVFESVKPELRDALKALSHAHNRSEENKAARALGEALGVYKKDYLDERGNAFHIVAVENGSNGIIQHDLTIKGKHVQLGVAKFKGRMEAGSQVYEQIPGSITKLGENATHGEIREALETITKGKAFHDQVMADFDKANPAPKARTADIDAALKGGEFSQISGASHANTSVASRTPQASADKASYRA